MSKPQSWAGVDAADRRTMRRQMLLTAALDVVGAEGLSGVTLRAVCRQAELNTRYFYESFANVDELLGALHDQLVQDTAVVAYDAVRAADNDREVVYAFIHVSLARISEDPRRARVLYTDATSNPVLATKRRETLQILIHTIAPLSTPAAGPNSQYPTVAAIMAGGAMAELAGAWAEGRLGDDLTTAVDHATDFMFASLGPTHVLDGVQARAMSAFELMLGGMPS